MALALQSDLEKFLQIDVTAEPDAAVTMLLENATAIIESYCQRTFASASVVETHDGGSWVLFLKRPPIASITTVVENAVALAATDYQFYEDGRLYRLTSTYPDLWYVARRTVVVTYVGGYATIPHDIRDTCVRIAARAFELGTIFAATPAGAGGVQSVALADSDSVSYFDSAVASGGASVGVQLTDDDRRVLSKYRLMSVA